MVTSFSLPAPQKIETVTLHRFPSLFSKKLKLLQRSLYKIKFEKYTPSSFWAKKDGWLLKNRII
jgi:hypothetical protein